MKPHPTIASTLLSAVAPCPGFTGTCQGQVTWSPAKGHVPRGCCGAIGSPEEVGLVLVCAEPGDPHEGEVHSADGTAAGRLDSVLNYAWDCFAGSHDQFHLNIRAIIEMCWPGLAFEKQLRCTWITDSILCSAAREGASMPIRVARECIARNLMQQIALFPNAIVVALGRKAQVRLQKAGVTDFISAYAAAPPGCNFSRAKPSWEAAARAVRARQALPKI